MNMKLHLLLFVLSCQTTSKVLLTSQPSKSRRVHKTLRHSQRFKEPNINIGDFTNALYKGKWVSSKPSQNDFINGYSGSIVMAFGRTEKSSRIMFEFIFNEGYYIEDRYMAALFALELTDDGQTVITGKSDKNDVYKVEHIFSEKGEDICNLSAELRLYNRNGTPQNITTGDVSNLLIEGYISSDNCDLNVEFSISAISIDILTVMLFVLIQVGAVVCGFYPFYNAYRSDDFTEIDTLCDTTLLLNIAIDMMILTMNLTLSMRIVPEYFEFLSIFTIALFSSLIFKMRAYISLFEKRVFSTERTFSEISQLKSIFFLKFIGVCLVGVVFADFLFVYYKGYLLVALYPLVQILYNTFNVIRNNCFKLHVHGALMISQFMYPLGLRCFNSKLFQLRQDSNFGIVLISILVAQIMIMNLQKLFGPAFYLPKILIPGYFEYTKRLNDLENPEDFNCPICFGSLLESPDCDVTTAKKLLPYRYMETPCKHKYHESCLKSWMEQKMICPCCRATIPPY